MDEKSHWENVYTTKKSDEVSWFQPHATTSLDLIKKLECNMDAQIIDVGGGASMLVDDLLSSGYKNLKVLDISYAALEVAKKRLGEQAKSVEWIVDDVTKLNIPKHSVDVWHDRAVFHFLNGQAKREAYVKAVLNAVKPGGHVIVSTFSLNGPEKCSGLPVQRYDAESLHGQFGEPFILLGHEYESHKTPFGTDQKFIYCYCRVANA
jgi:2-polyprenyl-3-methyl-5-hydroxy-6-metoxy-1,4-benzoquinol methylase